MRFMRWEPGLRALFHGRPVYDPDADQKIPTSCLPDLVLGLPPPMGLMGVRGPWGIGGKPRLAGRRQAVKMCFRLAGLNQVHGEVEFLDTLKALMHHNSASFKENNADEVGDFDMAASADGSADGSRAASPAKPADPPARHRRQRACASTTTPRFRPRAPPGARARPRAGRPRPPPSPPPSPPP